MVCNILRKNGKTKGFACGKFKVQSCKKCGDTETEEYIYIKDKDGYITDIKIENGFVLCDFPIGNGKTCDTVLCKRCANHIGDDLDLCDYHYNMYKKILEKNGKKDNVFWLKR